MNKGALRAFGKRSARPWVYIPIRDPETNKSASVSPAGLNGFSVTADATHVFTGRVDGEMNIPTDGSVRAFRLVLIGRNTTAQDHNMTCYSYRSTTALTMGPHVVIYYGKFAGDYSSNMGMVMTGGLGNTQFQYSLGWVSGTGTCYIRIVGFYVEAD